jgi:hypothetical protein
MKLHQPTYQLAISQIHREAVYHFEVAVVMLEIRHSSMVNMK